ncbi:MAG: hypothetical protein AABY18_02750 [Candidatus Thermoplasmatota archaeon]
MSLDRPRDYHQVVRAHAAKTRGFILAERHPCLDIQAREVAAIRRDLERAFAANLADLKPPASWLLAVILCPGDDTQAIANWTKRLPTRDVDRVRFYAHADVDLAQALEAWVAAQLPPPRLDACDDWKEFHRQFGLHLNDQTYRDAMQSARR